jgi:hypothetical protein
MAKALAPAGHRDVTNKEFIKYLMVEEWEENFVEIIYRSVELSDVSFSAG